MSTLNLHWTLCETEDEEKAQQIQKQAEGLLGSDFDVLIHQKAGEVIKVVAVHKRTQQMFVNDPDKFLI